MTFKRLSSSFYPARAVDNGFVQLLVSGVSKADKFTRLFFFFFFGRCVATKYDGGAAASRLDLLQKPTRLSKGFIPSSRPPPPAVTRWTRLIYRRHLHVR